MKVDDPSAEAKEKVVSGEAGLRIMPPELKSDEKKMAQNKKRRANRNSGDVTVSCK